MRFPRLAAVQTLTMGNAKKHPGGLPTAPARNWDLVFGGRTPVKRSPVATHALPCRQHGTRAFVQISVAGAETTKGTVQAVRQVYQGKAGYFRIPQSKPSRGGRALWLERGERFVGPFPGLCSEVIVA
jgi:hypothetical protein